MAIAIAHQPLKKIARAQPCSGAWRDSAWRRSSSDLSRSFALSLLHLFLVGATDMVSVIVRATLIQVATPDEMRGRVNAVDMIFIGASNELGQFESGIDGAMVWHGSGGDSGRNRRDGGDRIWAWIFPQLRKVDQLHGEWN